MIKIGQSWMRHLKAWVQGQKHPDTPRTVFMNAWECDRLRRILKSRCALCGYVVSDDERLVKEILYKCEDPRCRCNKLYGAMSHRVCDLCYNMFHSLYVNYLMKNTNYFKDIDEKEKAERDDPERRKRMGL